MLSLLLWLEQVNIIHVFSIYYIVSRNPVFRGIPVLLHRVIQVTEEIIEEVSLVVSINPIYVPYRK